MKGSRTIKVDYLARVEGEGSLLVKIAADRVTDLKFKIFEPPRFFEAFLRGRDYVTPDMVKHMASPVLEHRLIVRPQAAALGKTASLILKEVLDQVLPPV